MSDGRLTWDQIEKLMIGEPVNNKINVKRWTGFMATFNHGSHENGGVHHSCGVYRSFGDSIDEVVESIRKRPDPSVKNAVVYCEPSAIPPGENTIETMTHAPGKSREEMQERKRLMEERKRNISIPVITAPIGITGPTGPSCNVGEVRKIACVVCGKEEPERHPGHFLCGSSTCREALVGSHKAAARALTFLSGLNFQDHSTKEQKEYREVLHLLLKATKPERYGK